MQPEHQDLEIANRLLAAHERALETARSHFKHELNVLVQELSGDAPRRTAFDVGPSPSIGKSALKNPMHHDRATEGAFAHRFDSKAYIVDLDGEKQDKDTAVSIYLPDDEFDDEDAPTTRIHSSLYAMLQNNQRAGQSKRSEDEGTVKKSEISERYSISSNVSYPDSSTHPRTIGSSVPTMATSAASGSAALSGTGTHKNISLRTEWQHHRDEEETAEVLTLARNHKTIAEGGTRRVKDRASMREIVRQFKVKRSYTCYDMIASPGANWRLFWDLSGALLIGYDTVAIPFGLAFQPKENAFSTMMDWLTMIFWTLDMVFTFFVGFIERGVTVMSPARIAKRYLTTWFILDALVVAGDWFNNVGSASSSGSNVSGLGKLVRSLRAIRILRLLRLLKLKRMLAELQDHINSEYTYLLLSLTKLLFFILLLNHGISCLWWWLGRTCYRQGSESWVGKFDMIDRELGFQYTTSMHWTLTQFTPASMEVVPQNTIERTMAVFVLMFALVAFSSFVGSISTSMTALRNMNADTNKQFWMLRRYFKQCSVQKPVARRVLKYLEYIVEYRQGKVQFASIKILSMLSEQLREELTYELTKPNLQGNLFFQYSSTLFFMEPMLRRICTHAMTTKTYAREDIMFYVEDDAKQMYCLLHGHVEYRHTVSKIVTQSDPEDFMELVMDPPVQDLEWVSEAALWCPWKHMGSMRAVEETEMIATNVAKFIEECCKSIKTWAIASHFGTLWIDLVKDLDPTDVIRDEAFRITLEQQINPTDSGIGYVPGKTAPKMKSLRYESQLGTVSSTTGSESQRPVKKLMSDASSF